MQIYVFSDYQDIMKTSLMCEHWLVEQSTIKSITMVMLYDV